MNTVKKLLFVTLTVIVALVWVGCSSSSGYDNTSVESYEYATEEAPEIESMPTSTADSDVAMDDERMVIKTANLEMQTTQYDSSLKNIRAEVEKHGGEITDSNSWSSGSDDTEYRSIELTIRVPSENYNALLNGVQDAATIDSMSENSEDVTLEYIDITARIDSLKAQEDRLIELMDMATSVTEIMEIEYQLSNVRYEREGYEQQRVYLERQVSMSTIRLRLDEVRNIVITQQGFLAGVAMAFNQGIEFLINLVSSLITYIAVLLPTLIFFGIIAAIIFAILKVTEPKRLERQRIKVAKRQERAMQMQMMMKQQPPMQPQHMQMQPPMQPPIQPAAQPKDNQKNDDNKHS